MRALPGRAINATIENVRTARQIGMSAQIVIIQAFALLHHLQTTNAIVSRMQDVMTLLDTVRNVMMVVMTASSTLLTIVTVILARLIGTSLPKQAMVLRIGRSARQHAHPAKPNLVDTVAQAPLISPPIISTCHILHTPTPVLETLVLFQSQ